MKSTTLKNMRLLSKTRIIFRAIFCAISAIISAILLRNKWLNQSNFFLSLVITRAMNFLQMQFFGTCSYEKNSSIKHVSHETDSNKAYFILQFGSNWLILQFLQIFAIFCNFSCNFEQFLVQFLQCLTIQNVKLYFWCIFSILLVQFLQFFAFFCNFCKF